MKIDYVMTSPVIVIDENQSIVQAADLMRKKNIGFLPVVADGFIVGVLTDRDIVVRAVCLGEINAPVKMIMTPNPLTVVSGLDVMTVAKMMANEGIRRIIITLDGQPIGVATTKDLLKAPKTLPYVLDTYWHPDVHPDYHQYLNSSPHDSVKIDDFPL